MEAQSEELIVFVHGTGAADSADQGTRWWQLESEFSNRLISLLGPSSVVAPPFHWSGANSELDRRKAGRALFDRLSEIERSGGQYHLVSHSHGGSVVWHALLTSSERAKKLAGLRSWCTIGTPFLTFALRWPGVWRWLTALIVSAAFLSLIYASNVLELPAVSRQIWSDGGRWPLIGYVVLLSVAAVLWLWAVARVLVPTAAKILSSAKPDATGIAASWYGKSWLGLWHPLDEPINSLAGTMGPAPRITPRRGKRLLFRAFPILGLVWDRIVLRAADEFAWSQVTDRAQGNDLANCVVMDVGRAPKPLEPGFDPLPREIVEELTNSANMHSVGLVAKVRTLLETAYTQKSTETVADRIGAVLTFQELIHTSYFDHLAVAKIIATHIGGKSVFTKAGLTPLPLSRTDPALQHGPVPTPRTALEFVAALMMFILPAIGLWVGIRSVAEAVVIPYTSTYQIEEIKGFVTGKKILAAGNGSKVADVLLEIEVKKGLAFDPMQFLDSIPRGKRQRQAAMRLAYAYGRDGRIMDIQELMNRTERAALQAEYAARILLLGIIGNSTNHVPKVTQDGALTGQNGGNYDPAFLALIDSYIDNLGATMKLSSIVRVKLTALVVKQLEMSGQTARAQQILDFVLSHAGDPGYSPAEICHFAGSVAAGRALILPETDVRVLIGYCSGGDRKAAVKRQVVSTVLFDRKLSGLLSFAAANDFNPLTPNQIEDFLFDSKDEDDVDKRIFDLLPDIILLERSPEQIMQVSKDDSWASRLGRNYLVPIIKLAELTRKFGATRLSNALLESVMRQRAGEVLPPDEINETQLIIQALVGSGQSDAARQLFAKYVQSVNSRVLEVGDARLATLSALTHAASSLADNPASVRYADEMLNLFVPEPTSSTGIHLSNGAMDILPMDTTRAEILLKKAASYALLSRHDLHREILFGELAKNIARTGAIRQARLLAEQVSQTDLALDALLAIVKSADSSTTGDLDELGMSDGLVTEIIENDVDNPVVLGDPLDQF